MVNEKIRKLCEERGYRFKPWEARPWEVDEGPCPWPGGATVTTWPKAQKLRRRLLKELGD